jgi:hypothetical protein
VRPGVSGFKGERMTLRGLIFNGMGLGIGFAGVEVPSQGWMGWLFSSLLSPEILCRSLWSTGCTA